MFETVSAHDDDDDDDDDEDDLISAFHPSRCQPHAKVGRRHLNRK